MKLSTSCGCGNWTRYIDVEAALRLTGSGAEPGLFAYPARIFDGGGLRCADIMIAPYQYPTLAILSPSQDQQTNICEVKLSTNYSGKNVPWTSSNQSPGSTENLKDMTYTYNGSSITQKSESYVWNMSTGADPRTLTVKIRDLFGTEFTRSVTVTYSTSQPFYVYRGLYGDSWKGKSISLGAGGGSYRRWSHSITGTIPSTKPTGAATGTWFPGLEKLRSLLAP